MLIGRSRYDAACGTFLLSIVAQRLVKVRDKWSKLMIVKMHRIKDSNLGKHKEVINVPGSHSHS